MCTVFWTQHRWWCTGAYCPMPIPQLGHLVFISYPVGTVISKGTKEFIRLPGSSTGVLLGKDGGASEAAVVLVLRLGISSCTWDAGGCRITLVVRPRVSFGQEG
jgi:hypothetical protein